MWYESKKWHQLLKDGGHAEVHFDVFCGQCNKQLAENVDVQELHSHGGIETYKPMEIFCSCKYARAYEKEKNVYLQIYGITSLWSDPFIRMMELTERLEKL